MVPVTGVTILLNKHRTHILFREHVKWKLAMREVVIILSKGRFVLLILIAAFIIISAPIVVSVVSHRSILAGKVIVVDPGHGGLDGGANNRYILEKNINLDIALMLQNRLEQNGATVIMTRTKDVELSKSRKPSRERYLSDLSARVNIINNSSADMFISIHANSSTSAPSVRGAIAFYSEAHPRSREIAYAIQSIFNNYGFEYQGKTYKSRHTPQKGNYYLTVNAKIPGIIIETGFISNGTDLMFFKKPEYKKYIADAICQGISNYFLSRGKQPGEIQTQEELYKEDTIIIEEGKEL